MSTVSVIYDLIGRDNVSGTFDKAGRSAEGLHGRLSQLGKAAVLTGAALAAGAVAVGVESVKAAVTFQASMERVHTQAGVAQDKIAGLSQGVLQLAGQVGENPDSLAESFYHVASNMASMGATGPQMLNAVKIAAEGARVGGADLVDVTNALGAAIASGIPGVQNYQSAMGVLNATVGAGDMKMQDLADAMGTGFLSNVKLYGATLNDVGAALATFGDNNIRGAMAGTELRMAVQAIAVQAKSAGPALKTLGLQVGELGKYQALHGTVATVDLLSQKLKAAGIPANEYGQIITNLFGKKAGAGIGVLIDQVDRLNSKQAVLNQGAKKFGSEWQATQQTAAQQFADLKSGIDALGIKLGLALLPPVTAFVKFLNNTAVPDVSGFARTIARMIPVDTIKKDFGQVETLIKKDFGLVGTWIDNLFGLNKKPVKVPVKPELDPLIAWKTGPVTLPVKLGPVTGGTGSLYNLPTATIQARLGPQIGGAHEQIFNALPEQAKKTTNTFADSLMAAVKKINWGKLFATVISGAVTGAQDIGAAFLQLLGKINWTSLGGVAATALVGLAVGIVNNLIPALIGEAIHHPLDMVMFILSLIPIGKAAGILIKVLADVPILGTLVKFFLGPVEKVGGLVESALGKMLGKVFGPVGRLIQGYFKDAESWLLGKGESVLLGLWYGAERGLAFLLKWWLKINGFLLSPFAKAGEWLLSKGGDIIGGLLDGLSRFWGKSVWPWLGRIGGWILSIFAKAGSWLLGKGSDIIGGLWDGQKQRWSAAWGWLTRIGGWIIGAFAKAAGWLIGHGRDIIAGLWNGQKTQWSAVWSWITKIGGWIIGNFAKAGKWLIGHGGDIINGLKNGMINAMKDIGSWVKNNVVDPVINWVKHHFGIKSPSTVMAWIGGHLMGGLFKGMMSHDLTGMVEKIFGSLPNALAALVKKGLVSITSLPGKALSALGGLFGGGSSALNAAGAVASGAVASVNESIGALMAAARGWTGSQLQALLKLWTRESGWNTFAKNPTSGAYGIPQSLPASKMASAGPDWLTNPATQIKWGLGYIGSTYGSPLAAWAHEVAAGWYGHGGKFAAGQLIGVGERGPELAVFDKPGSILSPEQTAALGTKGGDGGPLVGTLNVNHVPGFTSTSDIENALTMASRQVRLARR